jgi:curved DNA-binding protein
VSLRPPGSKLKANRNFVHPRLNAGFEFSERGLPAAARRSIVISLNRFWLWPVLPRERAQPAVQAFPRFMRPVKITRQIMIDLHRITALPAPLHYRRPRLIRGCRIDARTHAQRRHLAASVRNSRSGWLARAHQGWRGKRGDLYLEIEFRPHPFYRERVPTFT